MWSAEKNVMQFFFSFPTFFSKNFLSDDVKEKKKLT